MKIEKKCEIMNIRVVWAQIDMYKALVFALEIIKSQTEISRVARTVFSSCAGGLKSDESIGKYIGGAN